jgi:hypothetical protein
MMTDVCGGLFIGGEGRAAEEPPPSHWVEQRALLATL